MTDPRPRLQLFPARTGRRRRGLLAALAASVLLHAFGGSILARLPRLETAREEVAGAQRITVEHVVPTPVPTPTPAPPTPAPLPTPTPVPRPSAAPAVPRLATAPRSVAVRRAPPHLIAPHELARTVPHASPQPRQIAAPAHVAYSASQLASLDAQFRGTIASAQHAIAEGPPQTGGTGTGTASTMKRYKALTTGYPADILGGGGLCDNLDEQTRGAYTYIYWQCRVRYDDGYTETVAFPWPFVYPRGHTPRPNENFPAQPPPPGFHLADVFALSRQVCYYFRDRCDAVLARERAAGAPDYGTPP